jgi:uncharacterized integral membrane protein
MGEALFLPVMVKFSGLPAEQISSNTVFLLLLPLPQIGMSLLLILLCGRYQFHIFNVDENRSGDSIKAKRNRTMGGLITILFLVIILQILFNLSVTNADYNLYQGISLTTIGIISNVGLILGVIVIGFLIMQLLELSQKEDQYQMQAIYIETLDELYTAIRSERHDIINHLQTIYGFNQLGYTQEVQNYLDDLLGGNILSNEFIITGTPGLTALFYIKSGIAKNHGILFNVAVRKQIDNIPLSPYELNNILGNLINNAFDAVLNLENDRKIVNVNIDGNENFYILKVENYGTIDNNMIKSIMNKGFSTKSGEHAGLGLHITDNLVKKYGGYIEIRNKDNNMVEFSVYIPAGYGGTNLDEHHSSKVGSLSG